MLHNYHNDQALHKDLFHSMSRTRKHYQNLFTLFTCISRYMYIYIYIVFLFFGGGTCLQPSPGACCASAESLRYTFHGEVTDWNGHTDQKTRAHMGVPWLGWGSVGQSPYFSYTPTWTTSHSRATSPSCATSSWSSCWCFTWQSELDQGKA